MARPPLALGTAGSVRTYRTTSGWVARTLFRDFDGHTRPLTRSGSSQAAARRSLAEAVRDRVRLDSAVDLSPDSKVSVLADAWFTSIAESDLSASTVQAYRDRLDRQVLPALGNLRLRELSVGLVERHLRTVRATSGPSLAKTTKSVLSSMCGYACRRDAMAANPCREVSRIPVKPRSVPVALSGAEVRQLRAFLTYDELAVAHDLPDLVGLLCATGMRIGEVCALSWDQVDLAAGTLEVAGTVIRVRTAGLQVKAGAKTKAGSRVLELPPWAVLLLSTRARSSGLVFPSVRGGLRDVSNTRRAMQQAFERAGFSGLKSHTFRKSVATLMDQAGLSPRAAADQLGHANVSMTTEVYMARKLRHTGAAGVLDAFSF